MSNAPKIVVVGSSNTDMVIQTSKFPAPGETIMGGRFFMNPGGKGANQAVAAARLGGNICFIAKTGNDIFGKQAIQQFKNEGMDASHVMVDPNTPSGVALITIDAKAENSIVVAPGANATLSCADIDKSLVAFNDAAWVLMQLETPIETIAYVARFAYVKGLKVILNPAPANNDILDILPYIYLLTPNETETRLLTGIEVNDETSALQAAQQLRKAGVQQVVITLGSQGAFVHSDTFTGMVPGVKTKAIDTTAAGDCFNGALTVALSEGQPIEQAIAFANRAASISVTRLGAQSSLPYRNELVSLMP